jgi:hypothetical protein
MEKRMNKRKLERAIKILTKASEVMTGLDREFKIKNSCYNLDYTIDRIILELEKEIPKDE